MVDPQEMRNFLHACKARKETPARDASQISNRLQEVFDQMEGQSAHKIQAERLKTGVEDMDRMIGGLELGELVAIDGAGGSGRTSVMLSFALETARQTQLPIMLCSQTHSAQQLTRRLLCMLSYIPIKSIEGVDLSDEQWNLLSIASNWLRKKDIRIFDLAQTVPELCVSMDGWDTPALMILDGLPAEELEPDDMRYLKKFAMEKTCCVLFNSHRPTTRPYIAGGVDKVLHLEKKNEDETAFQITWNRNGSNGSTILSWYPHCLQYLPLAPD